jgi:deltex-like protein
MDTDDSDHHTTGGHGEAPGGHGEAAAGGHGEAGVTAVDKPSIDDCVICLEPLLKNIEVLAKCKHKFHKYCIQKAFKTSNMGPKCPICGTIYGQIEGNQPRNAKMTDRKERQSLPGYTDSGTIIINYNVPSGMQSAEHPNPGKAYHGSPRTAYLPDNQKGNQVLNLLRRAFSARLIFTIGQSSTTGTDNSVIWNDIHHKTNKTGGQQK